MTTYIQFYNGEQPALGSDGCQPVDGRLSIPSTIMEAARRARSLRGVGKHYTAVRILRGASLREARPITGLITIKLL